MVSYKEIGLVNTREMFAKAVAGGYAIPAFNFNNMEQLQAIIQAAAETKSPVIEYGHVGKLTVLDSAHTMFLMELTGYINGHGTQRLFAGDGFLGITTGI